MKVGDLIQKIANGEEVPERIKYDTKVMTYDHNKQDYLGYYSNGNGEWLFQYLFDRCKNTEHFINDEVEVIEEKKIPKKLECYDFDDDFDSNTKCECLRERMLEIEDKINEIIDYLEENK